MLGDVCALLAIRFPWRGRITSVWLRGAHLRQPHQPRDSFPCLGSRCHAEPSPPTEELRTPRGRLASAGVCSRLSPPRTPQPGSPRPPPASAIRPPRGRRGQSLGQDGCDAGPLCLRYPIAGLPAPVGSAPPALLPVSRADGAPRLPRTQPPPALLQPGRDGRHLGDRNLRGGGGRRAAGAVLQAGGGAGRSPAGESHTGNGWGRSGEW